MMKFRSCSLDGCMLRNFLLLSVLPFFALVQTASSATADDSIWCEGARPIPQTGPVLSALRQAETYGLSADEYRLPLPENVLNAVLAGTATADDCRRFGHALSNSARRFVSHLHHGRVDPRSLGIQLQSGATRFDPDAALRELASSRDVSRTLESFEPAPAPYRRLKAMLGTYRSLARDNTLTRLPVLPARSIRTGDSYAGAQQLRRLLRAVGDLERSDADTAWDAVDPALSEAVKQFQRRHGLEADGIIGARTFAAQTTPLGTRVKQIELSMERWRWLSAMQKPNIVVNIPQFMLFALPRRAADDVIEMRVIVGKAYPHTRTPILSSHITQVVFQPYWDVPRGILVRELLPLIRKDPTYLKRHDMEIVRAERDDAPVIPPSPAAIEALAAGQLRLRQRPGPRNSLGPIKFVMPNPYSVHLHATPEQALFERAQRTFSHGCIRVSEPAALAAYVLQNAREPWSPEAIEAALCGTKMIRVPLSKPVPVVVFYTTAVVTRDGEILFLDDIYGHDRKLEQQLQKARDAR
jgi:murein L,D-transpeptidase YcbB/YkuD